MVGIGTIIGIAASVFQAVQAMNRPDPAAQKADQLFSQLDASGKGSIDNSDLQSAFDKITAQATLKSDQLFNKLDADNDGKVTQSEFSSSINRLAEQLDQHYMRLRMQGENAANASFSRDELSGLASSITTNFSQADANGDGKISIREARHFSQANPSGASTPGGDGQNVELMMQVMRLMQAYGSPQTASDNRTQKISTSA
jgi:Ca2+-binding EF-hand superfamily protein